MDSIYTTFSPREYILETLSLKKQAKQLISYFEALDDTIQISNKKILLFPWRSNFLLKILWFLTDNPLLPVKPIITKIYRLINKIQ